jgi:hypothetical protein
MGRAVCSSFALCALLALCSGCGGKQEGEPGAPEASQTPEAAFAAFQDAAEEKDWKAVAELLTPESQQSLAGAMIFAASLVAAFEEEKGEEIEELLAKHGLDPDVTEGPDEMDATSLDEALKAIAGPIANKPAFIADMIGWLDENAEESGLGDIASGKLGDVTISGDTASATITDDEGPNPIEFRRLNGRWLIHVPEEETGMGPGFEDISDWSPADGFDDFDADFAFGFEEGDPLPPVEAMSIDSFNSAWKTSLDVSDGPAIEILRQLAQECGLEMQEQDDVAEPLLQPVTIKLDAVSRLEAIEKIAQQVGLYPRYTLRKLGFRQGPRPLPAAFAGPFLIEGVRLDESVPYATGSLELRLLAAAIPTPAIAHMKSLDFSSDTEADDTLTFRLLEVTGTGGQNVLNAELGGMVPQATRTLIILARTIGLKNLIRSVVEVERLKGELSFAIPTKMATLTFANIDKGATASAEGISMKIRSVHLGQMSTVEVEFEGTDSDRVTIVPLGADGKALEVSGSGSSDFDGKGTCSVFVEGTLASIQAHVIQETDRVRLPFELGGIPLESHGQMPEAIEPLKFEGDEPIVVEFVEFKGSGDSKKIVLRVINDTNKDLASLYMRLNYYDASDKKLDDSPHSHSAGRSFVPAGGTEDIEAMTFLMPDETRSVRVEVISASFADATEWEGQR